MTSLIRDLRSGWRFVAARPGWTTVAVASLGLGIGVNTVMFSIVESVVLRPFPYLNPDRVVLVLGSRDLDQIRGLSAPDIEDWRAQSMAIEDAAIYGPTVSMSPGVEPVVPVGRLGPNVLKVLGVGPLVGRGFLPSDPDSGGISLSPSGVLSRTESVVMLSFGFWQSRYGGSPDVIGDTLDLNGVAHEIIGVMPRGFFFPEHNVELWTNLGASETLLSNRNLQAFRVVARLRPGVSVEALQAEIDFVNRRLDEEYPLGSGGAFFIAAAPGGGAPPPPPPPPPGGSGTPEAQRNSGVFPIHEASITNYTSVLWMLLGAVGLVLLIACANVANLLLARSVARHKELALRATLGAGRWTLIRQLLAESLLLSTLAGACALGLAFAGIRLVPALGLIDIPRIGDAALNWPVLAFAAVVAVATGVASGLLPALKGSRVDLSSALKQGSQSSLQSGNSRLRDSLVVAEIAVALVLLVGAGLLVRSSVGLSQIQWGFEPEGLSVVSLRNAPSFNLGLGRAPGPTENIEFAERILERLRTIPEIRSASAAINVPLVASGIAVSERIVADGSAVTSAIESSRQLVTRGYFDAMGIPVEGRAFQETDDARAQPVVVLSRRLARQLFPSSNAVGRIVHFATVRRGAGGRQAPGSGQGPISIASVLGGSDNINDYEVTGETAHLVIGVADDVKSNSNPSAEPEGPSVYVDYRQVSPPAAEGDSAGLVNALAGLAMRPSVFVVRADENGGRIVEAVKRVILDISPETTFIRAGPMSDLVSQSVGGTGTNKLLLLLSLVFGTLSLVLAAAGIYGVMSYSVSQRRFEIGVRLAIGARPAQILSMVLKHGSLLAVIGIGIGLGGAWAATRLLESLLFGISTTDVATWAGVTVFLAGIAVMASLVPARRAAEVDPLTATRSE